MSRLDLTLEPQAAGVRRVEVITGAGGRWRWSEGEKSRAVEASLEPGVVVSVVARQHGVTQQQFFTWRREARLKAQSEPTAEAFVPVALERPTASGGSSGEANQPLRPHSIELDVEGS